MSKASDNLFPKVILEEVATDGSATDTPAADHRSLFLGEDGALHLKDSADAVTNVGGDVSAHTGDATDAHDASAISVLDAGGNFTGTDVEAVLAELAAAGGTDDQTAAEVPFTPAGTIAATDVQAAIEEVAAEATGGGGSNLAMIRAAVDRTLTSTTSSQKLFGDPTNGRLTLTTGVYRFRGLLVLTSMSATSGNGEISVLGAGTATISNWLWGTLGVDGSTLTVSAFLTGLASQASNTNSNAVSPGAGTQMRVLIEGHFDCTGAGTLIPSIALTTAAAAVLEQGSFFEIERIADTAAVSVGSWD